jgi:hypothetical protein
MIKMVLIIHILKENNLFISVINEQLAYRHDILGMIINEISCIDRSCLLYASVE